MLVCTWLAPFAVTFEVCLLLNKQTIHKRSQFGNFMETIDNTIHKCYKKYINFFLDFVFRYLNPYIVIKGWVEDRRAFNWDYALILYPIPGLFSLHSKQT